MSRVVLNPYKGKHSKKYRAEVSIGSGKGRVRKNKAFDSKKEALAWVAEFELNNSKDATYKYGDMNFSSWFMIWFDLYKKQVVSPSTADTYIYTFKHIAALLPNLKVSNISRPILQSYFNELGKEHAKETLRKDLSHIKMALRDAVADGVIPRNPAANVVLPSTVKTRTKQDKIMTSQQYVQLREYLKVIPVTNFNVNSLVLLLITQTAMRVSEVLAVRKSDIDWNLKNLTVKGSYDHHNNQVKDTKTPSGHRIIPLTDLAMDLLTKLVNAYDHINFKNDHGNEGLLFLNEKGKVPYPSSINSKYHAIQRELGFDKFYSTHMLRHYVASKMIEKGEVSMAYISNFLGHSSAQITSRYYLGLVPDDMGKQDTLAKSAIASM